MSEDEFDAVLDRWIAKQRPWDLQSAIYLLLKQNPALAARTIFITGDTVSPDTRAFLQDVKNPVLAKPFKLREVRETIGRILDES